MLWYGVNWWFVENVTNHRLSLTDLRRIQPVIFDYSWLQCVLYILHSITPNCWVNLLVFASKSSTWKSLQALRISQLQRFRLRSSPIPSQSSGWSNGQWLSQENVALGTQNFWDFFGTARNKIDLSYLRFPSGRY